MFWYLIVSLVLLLSDAIPSFSGENGFETTLIEKITQKKWQRVVVLGPGLPEEVTTWEFYADGSFRWNLVSDYSINYIGTWVLSGASLNTGVLFLISTPTNDKQSIRNDVLSITYQNANLKIGEMVYQAVSTVRTETPAEIRQGSAIKSVSIEKLFPLWGVMIASNWRSETVPSPGYPDTISFSSAGGYNARFESTDCQYEGTWSLLTFGQNIGKILLSAPANRCDPRGPREGFIWELPAEWKDNTLFLYKSAYLPFAK